ncbi:RimK/LysX family protein [Hahella sp. CR1]|uniref:ATP-dependent zinc protease family protein n=1 Tax=Hahella sp. CR1 TaxID=2992807 RepID=UPI002441857E|nr:RimK/LysX family protein [Hahella sp. CR1]MDG9669556.1 RimK/LysX family protein [Hahella sp. CR1]
MTEGAVNKLEEAVKNAPQSEQEQLVVGWREWLALPELGISRIKAKVDTGARTSALHAFELESYESPTGTRVRFAIHPVQGDSEKVIECDAAVIDQRMVSDSGGHREMRFVISTLLQVGGHAWPVEMTLTNRDSMRFRMLLGRTAMAGRIQVNPAASYLMGKIKRS